MNVDYKRDLQNNYLIIEIEELEQECGYGLQMAEQNEIPGLLPFHSSRTNEILFLQYEITSKQTIHQLYGRKQLSGEVLIEILSSIMDLLSVLQDYLLNPSQILFDPQYIYVCSERKNLQFCYLPGKDQSATVEVLAEYFLKHLDHEDIYAVEVGYQFYQYVQEENFSLKKCLKEILKREKERKTQPPKLQQDNQAEELRNERWNKNVPMEEDKLFEPIPNYAAAEKSAASDRETDGKRIPEIYHVTHKERKKESSQKKITERLFRLIHPAVLLSSLLLILLIEVVFYLRWINLTEAGGIFFLVISIEMMVNQSWKKRKEQKEKREIRWVSEEEDAMYRMLQDEMYDLPQEKEEEPEETRFLGKKRDFPELRLIPAAGNKRTLPDIVVGENPVLIGKRKGESDVILDSPTVSRTHALIEWRNGKYVLCDLNSKNGTFCNGEQLNPQEKRNLSHEDRISFAEMEYRVVLKNEKQQANDYSKTDSE